jgi:hypothetical protein
MFDLCLEHCILKGPESGKFWDYLSNPLVDYAKLKYASNMWKKKKQKKETLTHVTNLLINSSIMYEMFYPNPCFLL